MKKISTEKAPAAIGPYCQAMVHGDMVFTSGQISLDPVTGEVVGEDVTELNYDLSLISKKNKSVKLNNLLCENINMSDVFSDEDICEYVKTLASPTQFKYGLLFIVESLDTHSKTGAVWVAIIETNTHTPVLCEKFLKVPSGFGTKNYWGRIFYNLLFDIKSYAFYRWENLVRVNN